MTPSPDLIRYINRRQETLITVGVPQHHPSPSSRTPYLDKRKWMIETKSVPTISSLQTKWGKCFAEILMKQMSPIEKRLMGIHAPLKGPPETLWIDPKAYLNEGAELTKVPSESYLVGLSYEGVLKVSEAIKVKNEKYDKFMIDVAAQEVIAYEKSKAKRDLDEVLKKNEEKHQKVLHSLQECLETAQNEKVNDLKSFYSNQLRQTTENLKKKYSKKKCKIIADAVQRLRNQLVEIYEENVENSFESTVEPSEDETTNLEPSWRAEVSIRTKDKKFHS